MCIIDYDKTVDNEPCWKTAEKQAPLIQRDGLGVVGIDECCQELW